jgi:hypothetical protein
METIARILFAYNFLLEIELSIHNETPNEEIYTIILFTDPDFFSL